MSDAFSQRQIAAAILKVGLHRVWINPEETKTVEGAITREDIKRLIAKGIIAKRPEKGTSRVRARARQEKKKKGRIRGPGGNRGKRVSGKREWINTIRPIRRLLKALLQKEEIDKKMFKDLYRKASGGFFRSKTHVKLHIQKGAPAKAIKEMKQ
ncbi:MAG: 50S ribosomal protein L19e [archaeon]